MGLGVSPRPFCSLSQFRAGEEKGNMNTEREFNWTDPEEFRLVGEEIVDWQARARAKLAREQELRDIAEAEKAQPQLFQEGP